MNWRTAPCHGDPSHPSNCDCAAWERYQESDAYEQDCWIDSLIAAEPDAVPCPGVNGCPAITTGSLCADCAALAADTVMDAYLETIS